MRIWTCGCERLFRSAIISAIFATFGLSSLQASSLILSGDGMTVYDPVNNITWLTNFNLAASNQFGVPLCSPTAPNPPTCINASGSMRYDAATTWIAGMNAVNYLGHNNWQLPTSPLIDDTCAKTGPNGGSFGFGCAASAFGSLYLMLGLRAPSTAVPIPNNTVGPFGNFQPYLYWSQSDLGQTTGNATFSFATGFQGANTLPNFLYALPMLPGKIAGTPTATGNALQVNPGGQTVYDPVTNITWAANANLAATNTFGLPNCTNPTTPAICVVSDGAMTFASASQFIANMNSANGGAGYLGQTHWQLPTIDPTCPGYNCGGTLNPMGNLFYTQLGIRRGMPVVAPPNTPVGPFNNIQPYLYWTCQAATIQSVCGTDAPAPNFEWSYSFGSGFQGTDLLANSLYATAYFVDPPPAPFTLPNRGGTSTASSGTGSSIAVGYGEIEPNSGSTTPSGVAIFDFRQNNILVSEVGVPATAELSAGRLYSEIAGAVDAGIAIVNPNSSPATINFYFTDASGNPAGSGTKTIGAYQQIAQFLDQSPFKVYTTPTFQGTFSFSSSVPVAVVALRGFINERGDFLMSTLPVIDTTVAASAANGVIPHFADGGGWTTQVLLVNPTDNPITGTVQFTNPAGAATNVTIGSQTGTSFAYSIPKRSSAKLVTSGSGSSTQSGSIVIVPASGGAAPTPLVLFAYKPASITVSVAGVPVSNGSAFRVYVEASGAPGQIGNIESGIAVSNLSAVPAAVTFAVTDLTGAPVSGIPPVMTSLASFGQTAKFLSDIFPLLPSPFKGVLRITTAASAISVVGLRTRINERGDFLITTTPPANEGSTPPIAPLYFPQIADGGGYTTQFILYSGSAGQVSFGVLKLIKQDGTPLGIYPN